MALFEELNQDQLTGLSNLCFDLAKGAFVIALLPTFDQPKDPLIRLSGVVIALIVGLAFTTIALLLLKLKEIKRK